MNIFKSRSVIKANFEILFVSVHIDLILSFEFVSSIWASEE